MATFDSEEQKQRYHEHRAKRNLDEFRGVPVTPASKIIADLNRKFEEIDPGGKFVTELTLSFMKKTKGGS